MFLPLYPLEFTLFEDQNPELTDEMVESAARVIDEKYLAQGYYRRQKVKIKLETDQEEHFTYRDYSCAEAYLPQDPQRR